MTKRKLYQVRLSYSCFGVVAEDGVVTAAAPLAGWAVGKTLEEFESWVRSKGGTVQWTGWPPTMVDSSMLPKYTLNSEPKEGEWFNGKPAKRRRTRR